MTTKSNKQQESKLKGFVAEHLFKFTTGLFLVLFLFKGCGSDAPTIRNLKQSNEDLTAKVDSLINVVDNQVSAKEATDIMEKVMFEFLIYEDDLDKGKISRSQIKQWIEEND
jgi:hypothetical protein